MSFECEASKSGVKLLPASTTRSFIAVPPFTTLGGSICPTTVLATARWIRRTGRLVSRARLLSRVSSERRLVGGSSRLALTRLHPTQRERAVTHVWSAGLVGKPHARPRRGGHA